MVMAMEMENSGDDNPAWLAKGREESRLGWGKESFVDSSDEDQMADVENISASTCNSDDAKWSTIRVLIIDEEYEDAEASSDATANTTYLIPLIEQ
ncbi:hypothetical protein ACHAW5_005212 [Stephanodiscus triporus]|uniref:Uncharacterized protein n=1 Tax=Stephanodiscus triporus TaxID=2934178 RepID=A0ABD3MYE5_9STRA